MRDETGINDTRAAVVMIEQAWQVEFICPTCKLNAHDTWYGGRPNKDSVLTCDARSSTTKLLADDLGLLRKEAA